MNHSALRLSVRSRTPRLLFAASLIALFAPLAATSCGDEENGADDDDESDGASDTATTDAGVIDTGSDATDSGDGLGTGTGNDTSSDGANDTSTAETGAGNDDDDATGGDDDDDNDDDASTGVDPADVTYWRDIAPMLKANCTACHTAGGIGPFALDSFADASATAELSLSAMQSRRMPPWPPDPECRTYRYERLLEPAQIATFSAWVAAGKPEGNPSDAPPSSATEGPVFEPNLTTRFAGDYVAKAELTDDYHCFVLDIDTSKGDQYILGSDMVPSGTGVVHHVLVYTIDGTGSQAIQDADAAEAGPGYTCFGGPVPRSARQGSQLTQVAAWVPGIAPVLENPGEAIPLKKGSVVVAQVHFNTLVLEPRADEISLKLLVTEEAPERLVTTVGLPQTSFVLPAGDADIGVTKEFANPTAYPLQIAGVAGHMHLLGTAISVTVEREDGTTDCLMDIPRWDFGWQLFYRLAPENYLTLQPGDKMKLTCLYDNSAANQPVIDGTQVTPRDVRWGEGTLDEMCLAYIQTSTPYNPPDGSGEACKANADCFADCSSTTAASSFECLVQCVGASITCNTCLIEAVGSCGTAACGADLGKTQTCIQQNCGAAVAGANGDLDACMRANCPAVYTSAATCMSPVIDGGTCDGVMTGCGLTVP